MPAQNCAISVLSDISIQGFFLGGLPPPSGKILSIPPSNMCPRFWIDACPPPPPTEVHPQKFEYIFVSDLTTLSSKVP